MKFSWVYLFVFALLPSWASGAQQQTPSPQMSRKEQAAEYFRQKELDKHVPPEIAARVQSARSLYVTSGTLDHGGCVPYAALYQAVAARPGVTMADRPAHADLILEASSYTEADRAHRNNVDYFVRISLIDPATQKVLSRHDLQTGDCALAANDALSFYTLAKHQPKPLKTSAPLPAALRLGNKMFIQPTVVVPTFGKPYEKAAALDFDATAMLKEMVVSSGLYSLVDSASEADVVLAPTFQPTTPDPLYSVGAVTLSLLDPATKISVWKVTNDLISDRHMATDRERFAGALPFLMKDWKAYVSKGHL